MKRLFLILLTILLFLISGCGETTSICDKPHILVGYECCLDENDNSICDTDEIKEAVDKPIEETIIRKQKTEKCDLFIDDYCCEYPESQYSLTISGLCEGEKELYLEKEEKSFKNYVSAGRVKTFEDLGFSFIEPEGWRVMKNYKMAGMDVPISYFKYTDERRQTKVTKGEIRIIYYENKNNISIEDLKIKLVSLLTRGKKKSTSSTLPKSYKMPRESIKAEIEMKHNLGSGIYFNLYRYGNWDEDYYEVTIFEHKDYYVIVLYIDTVERIIYGISTYYEDPIWKQFDKITETFRFIDFKENEYNIKIDPNTIWSFPLNFNKFTKVRYSLKSEHDVDFYFVKSWDDFDEYVKNPRKEKFEFYEGCKHIGVKEASGSCVITESRFLIGNLKSKFNEVTLTLNWSD